MSRCACGRFRFPPSRADGRPSRRWQGARLRGSRWFSPLFLSAAITGAAYSGSGAFQGRRALGPGVTGCVGAVRALVGVDPAADGFEHVLADQIAVRQINRILAVEAGAAQTVGRLLGRGDQTVERYVAE